MKTMTAMQVRRHFGEVMDNVRLRSESVILERAGKPIAMIVPYMPENHTPANLKASRKKILEDMAGTSRQHPRAKDLAQWLDYERASWAEK
ncbi:MAG: type II toxin-antitoxin system Phd/YefM family antitoxin [Lentisphaerae bacterium]|nr:type II toxin-antitoxin system Phd/YefM family antitoxin [Lentisphaerota bacterium]